MFGFDHSCQVIGFHHVGQAVLLVKTATSCAAAISPNARMEMSANSTHGRARTVLALHPIMVLNSRTISESSKLGL